MLPFGIFCSGNGKTFVVYGQWWAVIAIKINLVIDARLDTVPFVTTSERNFCKRTLTENMLNSWALMINFSICDYFFTIYTQLSIKFEHVFSTSEYTPNYIDHVCSRYWTYIFIVESNNQVDNVWLLNEACMFKTLMSIVKNIIKLRMHA